VPTPWERIETLWALFKGFSPSNDIGERRTIHQLKWLRQETEARRLPMPLDHWSTLGLCCVWGGLRMMMARALSEPHLSGENMASIFVWNTLAIAKANGKLGS
jgi:hypothetical protein